MAKSSSILSILALVAAAQALNSSASDYHVAGAKHANRVAKFKEDNSLSEDEANALGAVLRAAETAPVSADATRAADVTAVLSGEVGPKGEEGPKGPDDSALANVGPTNESGAEGVEGEAGEDTVESLVKDHSKDELLSLAAEEGVEVDGGANKHDIAQAILDARAAK